MYIYVATQNSTTWNSFLCVFSFDCLSFWAEKVGTQNPNMANPAWPLPRAHHLCPSLEASNLSSTCKNIKNKHNQPKHMKKTHETREKKTNTFEEKRKTQCKELSLPTSPGRDHGQRVTSPGTKAACSDVASAGTSIPVNAWQGKEHSIHTNIWIWPSYVRIYYTVIYCT